MYTLLIDRENRAAFTPLFDPLFLEDLQDPSAVALGIVNDDDTAAGALLARPAGDFLDIDWLYVAPRFRGLGMGGLLLCKLIPAATKAPDLIGIFAEYRDLPNDEGLDYLFRTHGFRVTEAQKPVYTFTAADVAQNPFWQRETPCQDILPLRLADDTMRKTFQMQLAEGAQPVAVGLPIDWQAYMQDLSMVCAVDGKIRGVLLFQEEAGALVLAYAHVLPENGTALGRLLFKAGRSIVETYPQETPIRIATVGEAAEGIVDKLFSAPTKIPVRRAVLRF